MCRPRSDALYESGAGPHPHVHGANLGIRASAYLAAGGFRPLRTAEDHALLAAATEAGCPVVQASDITVQTSGRRQARAPLGFSHLLRTLAPLPNAPAESLPGQPRGLKRQVAAFGQAGRVPGRVEVVGGRRRRCRPASSCICARAASSR